MVKQEPTHNSQHEVASEEHIGLYHEAHRNVFKVALFSGVKNLLLHYYLQVEDGPPESSHGA